MGTKAVSVSGPVTVSKYCEGEFHCPVGSTAGSCPQSVGETIPGIGTQNNYHKTACSWITNPRCLVAVMNNYGC